MRKALEDDLAAIEKDELARKQRALIKRDFKQVSHSVSESVSHSVSQWTQTGSGLIHYYQCLLPLTRINSFI
jgi:hypothetical protein